MNPHELINRISQDYDIPANELISKYLGNKRRGRKRKSTEPDEYVETEELYYNGKLYLIDKNDTVYAYDIENPLIVGRRHKSGELEFY